METLLSLITTVARQAITVGAHASCAATLIGTTASCSGPEASIRREPARLVVESATFDDEEPVRTAAPPPRSPAPNQPTMAAVTPAVVPRAPEARAPTVSEAPLPMPKRIAPLSESGRARCEAIKPVAERLAEQHGVDSALIMAVARVESDYNPDARNKRTGAAGLMQVMPSTGEYFKCGDLGDADQNLACGVRVLRRYIDYFDGDLNYAVAAYHAGPKWSKKAKAQGLLPGNYSYIEKVMQLRTRFRRRGCG